MASEVAIANRALSVLGAEPITALTDNTSTARLANGIFADTRDTVLRAHPWNFAIKRIALGLLTPAPVSGWDNRFQLPTDCLRVIELNERYDSSIWAIEGRELLTDESEAKIKYIARITDTQQFDALFSRALSFALAADMAYAITGSNTVAAGLQQLYEFRLKEARSVDGQEGTPESGNDMTLLNARA